MKREQAFGIIVIIIVILGSSDWFLSSPMYRPVLGNENIEFKFSPEYQYGNFSVNDYEKNTAVVFKMDLDSGSDNRTIIFFEVCPRNAFFESFNTTDYGVSTYVGVQFVNAQPSIEAWVPLNAPPGDYVWVFFADPTNTTYTWTATFNVTLKYTLL